MRDASSARSKRPAWRTSCATRATGKPELSLHARIKVRLPAGRFPIEEFPAREIWDDAAGAWVANPVTGAPDQTLVLRRSGTQRRQLRAGRDDARAACCSTRRSRRTSRSRTGWSASATSPRSWVSSSSSTPRPRWRRASTRCKELGFEYSTRAGLTISISDVRTPAAKAEILDKHEKDAEKVEQQYDRGIITDDERRQKEIEIWTDATNQVTEAMQVELVAEQFNPIEMMVGSGARGNVMQVRQIAGMRGLVANPRGEIIPRPIKSNFREGLSVLEYFISTHGARKGLADTALRTADSGYLTRRLVDVAQELIVRDAGLRLDPWHLGRGRARRPGARPPAREPAAQPVPLRGRDARRRHGVPAQHGGHRRRAGGAHRTTRRSPGSGCAPCSRASSPGTSPAPRTRPPEARTRPGSRSTRPACAAPATARCSPPASSSSLGEAVGIIAAQSIGEPGTQLTMRTFHTGGVAGEDITHGLPRVVELFEARTPKGAALLAESSGVAAHRGEREGRADPHHRRRRR